MLTIIIGRAKTGKSTFCFRQFAQNVCAGTGNKPSYFVVPEQFALSTERQILHLPEMQGHTLMGDEVLSFKRLSHRILNRLGGLSFEQMDEAGKIMILTQAAYVLRNELTYFTNIVDHPWQVMGVLSLFHEFEKYGVNCGTLERLKQQEGIPTTLQGKLNDLSLLYAFYDQRLHEKCMTDSDVFRLAIQKASKKSYFKDTNIWIDSFTGFTAWERDFIALMMRDGATLTITLCMDAHNDPVFNGIRTTYAGLLRMAKELHVPHQVINVSDLYNDFSFYRKEDLRTLEQNYTRYRGNSYERRLDDSERGIVIHESDNVFNEITHVAASIQDLHNKQGIPYGQIAVAVRHMEGYSSLIEAIFPQYNIPYFVDNRRNIENNPVIICILSLLNILINGYRIEDISMFLKSGLYYDDFNLIDQLENVILAKQLQGEKKYRNTDCAELKKLVEDILSFKNALSASVNIRDCVVVLETLLNKWEFNKKLQLFGDHFRSLGEVERSDEYIRIWDILTHVLGQIKFFLGEISFTALKDKCTFLHRILSATFKSYRTGFLPQNPEAVQILGIDRSRTSQLYALFVMGANEGVLPASMDDTGMLSDQDRDWITSMSVELADDSLTRATKEQFNIYATLFAPSSYLCISYPLFDAAGNSVLPSTMVIGQIKRLYPNVHQTYDSSNYTEPSSLLPGRISLTQNTALALFLPNQIPNISVSRLETYRKCPFKYFMDYGLRAEERNLGQIDNRDIGDLMHKLIEKGTGRLLKEINLDGPSIMNDIFSETLAEIDLSSELRESERRHLLLNRLNRFSAAALDGIREQWNEDTFTPVGFEVAFGEKEQGSMPGYVIPMDIDFIKAVQLRGRIDRFDVYKHEGILYVRVIDYKSSDQRIQFDDVYLGQRLQLITYMKALIEQKKSQEHIKKMIGECEDVQFMPGGVLYFVMQDDLSKIDPNGKLEANNYCMDGFVLNDPVVVDAMRGSGDTPTVTMTKGKAGEMKAKKGFSPSDYQSMSDSVDQAVRITVREIASGAMLPKPSCSHKGTLPCRYCAYQSVCGIIYKKS